MQKSNLVSEKIISIIPIKTEEEISKLKYRLIFLYDNELESFVYREQK